MRKRALETVNSKMENSFGTSFSNVNIHKDDTRATQMGALAYTQGNNVHFAPGQYKPESIKGQELIALKLTVDNSQKNRKTSMVLTIGNEKKTEIDAKLAKLTFIDFDVLGQYQLFEN